jgi:hypothetical protein
MSTGGTLKERVERLAGKKRGKGRLKPAAGRDGIPASVAIQYPTSEPLSGGSGLPWTEQEYTGTSWLDLRSSDGLFVFEFPAETTYRDSSGNLGTVTHRDPALDE